MQLSRSVKEREKEKKEIINEKCYSLVQNIIHVREAILCPLEINLKALYWFTENVRDVLSVLFSSTS